MVYSLVPRPGSGNETVVYEYLFSNIESRLKGCVLFLRHQKDKIAIQCNKRSADISTQHV